MFVLTSNSQITGDVEPVETNQATATLSTATKETRLFFYILTRPSLTKTTLGTYVLVKLFSYSQLCTKLIIFKNKTCVILMNINSSPGIKEIRLITYSIVNSFVQNSMFVHCKQFHQTALNDWIIQKSAHGHWMQGHHHGTQGRL